MKFLQKYHMIHADWRFSLPPRYRARLTVENSVTWLWWNGSFTFEDVEIHGLPAQERELMNFAQSVYPRSGWLLQADSARRQSASFLRRGSSWLKRKLS
jgi:hypothetical protein